MLLRLLIASIVFFSALGADAQTVAPVPMPTYHTATGAVCAKCTLETYAAGTSTPLATYQNSTLVTPHTNPIVLNSAGRPTAPIYLSATSYKFILKSALGSTIWTADNVASVPANITGVSSSGDIEFRVDTDNDGTNVFSFLNGTSVQKAVLNESGDLQLDGGLTVDQGITFPATQFPIANANVLDDYEEGTWTPVIGGSGGTSGQTYSTQTGSYVKIGKLVSARFNVTLSAKGTITGSVQIQGLPFMSEATYLGVVTVGYFAMLGANYASLGGYMFPATSVAQITGIVAAGAASSTDLTTADIANTTQILGMITYQSE